MKNFLSLFFFCVASVCCSQKIPSRTVINLVPEQPAENASYVCTWAQQNSLHRKDEECRDFLDHARLFGSEGLLTSDVYWPKEIRGETLVVIDDGWDIPYVKSVPRWQDYLSSFTLDEAKFPGYGATPKERLKTMVDNVKAAGWKGLGVWVCLDNHPESFWQERMEWCKYAGVAYWKVDWGNICNNDDQRQMLSRLAKQIYPALVMEHCNVFHPFNGDKGRQPRNTPELYQQWAYTASYSDVHRTLYDASCELKSSVWMDRIGGLLQQAYSKNSIGKFLNLINGEGAFYLNAAMGFACGTMETQQDRNFTKFLRFLRWQRIAPAFRTDANPVLVSEEILSDTRYVPGGRWYSPFEAGANITQAGPAAVSRGIALPVVSVTEGDKPFAAVSRNPNGAIGIVTLGRDGDQYPGKYFANPTAAVSINCGDLTGKIGIFGVYGSLTLTFNQNLKGKTVLAQDLLADEAIDITDRVSINGNTITIPGNIINEIGKSKNPAGRDVEPGLVLQIMDVITVNPATVLRQLNGVPIGININFYLDSDEATQAPRTIAETIKAMGIKYLRYPGGEKSDEYLFAKPPYEKAEPHPSRRGKGASIERSMFMTPDGMDYKYPPMDFDQFMDLCLKTGCEPVIVVACDNYKNPHPEGTYSATREELLVNAVEWVRYANIKHGYHIRYWMIGNESWHPHISNYYTVDDYIADLKLFSDAMKAIDPSILIIANTAPWVPNFSRRIFSGASNKFDMICVSNYSTNNNSRGQYQTWASGKIDLIHVLKETFAEIEEYAPEDKKDMKVIVSEYAPFDWDKEGWGFSNDMGHAMCNFEMTYLQLLDDRVPVSLYWNTHWIEGDKPLYAALDKNNKFLPVAYSISLWANNLYPQIVEAISSTGDIKVFSSYDPEHNAACIYVMNLTDKEKTVGFEVNGKKISKTEFVGRINGKSPEDTEPVADLTIRPESKEVSLPAYSINVYRTYLK